MIPFPVQRVLLYLLLGACCVNWAAEQKPRKISLSSERMTLKQALNEIAQQTQLQFVYGDHLLQGIEVYRVGTHTDADRMLQLLLRHTGLKIKPNDLRRIIYADEQQQRVTLSGFVISGEDRLAQITVNLRDSYRTIRTDSRGYFRFESVPNQALKLHFYGGDFIPAEHQWQPGDTPQLIVILEKQPFVSEHIRVARLIDHIDDLSPIDKLNVDAEQLLAQNAVARDLFQGLEALAGVETGLGETGVSVRGARPSENLVLLDGIKLYQIDHAMGHFSALNPDAIGEVALYKGSSPANYGNRLAGVLDVSTRSLHAERLEATLGIDRDIAHISVKTPITSYAHVMVAARDAISDDTAISVSDRLFSSTFNAEQTDFTEFDYIESTRSFDFEDQLAHITVTPREDSQIKATFFRGRDASVDDLSYFASQFDERAVDEFYNRNGRWGNDGISLNWHQYWNASWSSSLSLSQSRFHTDFNEAEQYNVFVNEDELEQRNWLYFLDTEVREQSVQAQLSYEHNAHHKFEIGFFNEAIELSYYEELLDEFSDEEFAETRIRGGFAQHTWHGLNGLHTSLGFRMGNNTATDQSFFEPRLALRYDANDHWQWRTAWGKFHQFVLRTPDTASYFSGVPSWFLPEDDLMAAVSEHYQIGMRYQRGPFKFDIEPYYKQQRGSLSKLVEPLRFYYALIQLRERYRGIDLQSSWQRDAWTAKAAYSYRHSRVVRNETTDEAEYYPTDRDRPHVFDASLLWQGRAWDFWTGVHWQSGIPYTTPEVSAVDYGDYVIRSLNEPDQRNTKRLNHSSQLDLRLGYRFKIKRLRAHVSARVENLFDTTNPIYRFYIIENEYEREGAQLVPVDVNDFGQRFSLELRLAF